MDLISCRNLMIYLGAALQARALSIFHYALKEPGFLMLGSSETIHAFPGFANIDAASKIYQRTSAAPHLMFDFAASELSAVSVLRSSEALRASGPLDIHREADRLVLAKFAPPGVVITDEMSVVQFRGRTAPYLAPAPGVPSFELLRMVRDELRIPVRQAIDLVRAKRAPVASGRFAPRGRGVGSGRRHRCLADAAGQAVSSGSSSSCFAMSRVPMSRAATCQSTSSRPTRAWGAMQHHRSTRSPVSSARRGTTSSL